MVRILKFGLERSPQKDGLQLASLNTDNIQVWENLKKVLYTIKFSKRDTHSNSG